MIESQLSANLVGVFLTLQIPSLFLGISEKN